MGEPRAWSFKQRPSFRASTLLLLALPIVAVAYVLLNRMGANAAAQWAGAAGSMMWAIAGIAAVLSLVAFLASVGRRAPQCQFVVEFVVATALFLTAGRY